jgi:hypothetical protein
MQERRGDPAALNADDGVLRLRSSAAGLGPGKIADQ